MKWALLLVALFQLPAPPLGLRVLDTPEVADVAIAVREISTPARNTNQTTGGSTNYTINSTTAGDGLVAFVAYFNSEGNTVSGITGGGTWAKAVGQNLDANSHQEIWYAHNVTGSVTTLAVTMTGDGSPAAALQITVLHLSDMATSGALDVTPTATTGTGLTPSITSATLAQADEIVVQMNSHTGADLLTMVEDTVDGFSEANQNLDNDDGQTFEAQYKVVAATDSLAVATTYNASRDWGAILASFKGTAAASAFYYGGTGLPMMGMQ